MVEKELSELKTSAVTVRRLEEQVGDDRPVFDWDSILDIQSTTGIMEAYEEDNMVDVDSYYDPAETLPPPQEGTQELLDVLCNDKDEDQFLGKPMNDLEEFIMVEYDLNSYNNNNNNINSIGDLNDDPEMHFMFNINASSPGPSKPWKEEEDDDEKKPIFKAPSFKLDLDLINPFGGGGRSQEQLVNTPDVMNTVIELQQIFPSSVSKV